MTGEDPLGASVAPSPIRRLLSMRANKPLTQRIWEGRSWGGGEKKVYCERKLKKQGNYSGQ